MGLRWLAGRSTTEGQGKRAVWSWIARHSYHSPEQDVKDKKLDHRVKDLSVICSIKISKVDFGSIRLRDLKPEQIDKLTNELRERPGRKKQTLTGVRMNTLLIKVTRSILDLAYARGYLPKDPRSWFYEAA